MDKKVAYLIAGFAILVAVLAGGYALWSSNIPEAAPAPATTAPITLQKPLLLSKAECGNWQYTSAREPIQIEWMNKQSCVGELNAQDGKRFEIKQGSVGQSVAVATFTLPAEVAASTISSLEGRITGICRRQFEVKTANQYGEWKDVGIIPCPPDSSQEIDFKFTPEVHDDVVGIRIVSGDNFNRLQIDSVSVTASYNGNELGSPTD